MDALAESTDNRLVPGTPYVLLLNAGVSPGQYVFAAENAFVSPERWAARESPTPSVVTPVFRAINFNDPKLKQRRLPGNPPAGWKPHKEVSFAIDPGFEVESRGSPEQMLVVTGRLRNPGNAKKVLLFPVGQHGLQGRSDTPFTAVLDDVPEVIDREPPIVPAPPPVIEVELPAASELVFVQLEGGRVQSVTLRKKFIGCRYFR